MERSLQIRFMIGAGQVLFAEDSSFSQMIQHHERLFLLEDILNCII